MKKLFLTVLGLAMFSNIAVAKICTDFDDDFNVIEYECGTSLKDAIKAKETQKKAEKAAKEEMEEIERKAQAEVERLKREKIEQERALQKAKKEAEKKAKEEAERLEKERIAAEREAEKAARAAEKAEQARQKAAEKAAREAAEEAERLREEELFMERVKQKLQEEEERKAREEAEKLEKERLKAEREAQEAAEKAERARQKAQEKAEREAKEAAEKLEKERLEAEREAQEAAEKAERAKQKAEEEAERARQKAQEKAERAAKKEAERIEKERIAAEKAEKKAKEEALIAEKKKLLSKLNISVIDGVWWEKPVFSPYIGFGFGYMLNDIKYTDNGGDIFHTYHPKDVYGDVELGLYIESRFADDFLRFGLSYVELSEGPDSKVNGGTSDEYSIVFARNGETHRVAYSSFWMMNFAYGKKIYEKIAVYGGLGLGNMDAEYTRDYVQQVGLGYGSFSESKTTSSFIGKVFAGVEYRAFSFLYLYLEPELYTFGKMAKDPEAAVVFGGKLVF